jgi:hypothetical protein
MKRLPGFDALFFLFAAYLIIKGLINKEDSVLTAESGLGYMLGIVGGSMMLVLLLYPLRKHVRFMNWFGPVRYWFRIHMLLGVAGPVLILYHSNFSLGATNSNVALFCMLVVAGSGLFGRFFYSRIHQGLYGHKLEFGELRASLQYVRSHFDNTSSAISQSLRSLEQKAIETRSLFSALIHMPAIHVQAYRVHQQSLATLKSGNMLTHELASDLNEYFRLLVRLADYHVYERLFSLWHVFHIPLFIMMIISGIVHVFAVHIY